jgi:hypothetical protein
MNRLDLLCDLGAQSHPPMDGSPEEMLKRFRDPDRKRNRRGN